MNTTDRIYSRMIPLHHLNKIKRNNLAYIIQPIIKNGIKLKTPINHDNGGVLCIGDISEFKNQYKCQECQKDFDLSEIYYDISLQAIISNIWGDPALQQTKCVKILKDGSWQVLADDYKYFMDSEQSTLNVYVDIKQSFQILEEKLTELMLVNQEPTSKVYQEQSLIKEVKDLAKQIDFKDLSFDELDLFITRKMDQNYLSGFEMYYTAKNKREAVTIAILGKNLKRDQIKPAMFAEETKVFYTKDAIFLIGDQKIPDTKESGFQKVYVAYIKDFINDSRFWPDSKMISFKEISSLQFKRYQFQMFEYKDHLYVIGGYKKVAQDQPVLVIEKLNIKNSGSDEWTEKWSIETNMSGELEGGLHNFHCCVQGDLLIISGGVTIKSTQGIFTYRTGNTKTHFYNLSTRRWLASEDNIFQGDISNPILIPQLLNNEKVYALGGFGQQPENQIISAQKKEVYLYSVKEKVSTSLENTNEIIDGQALVQDLYSRDYLNKILGFLRKINDQKVFDALLIHNKKHDYNSQSQLFGTKVLAINQGKIFQIKIMK